MVDLDLLFSADACYLEAPSCGLRGSRSSSYARSRPVETILSQRSAVRKVGIVNMLSLVLEVVPLVVEGLSVNLALFDLPAQF